MGAHVDQVLHVLPGAEDRAQLQAGTSLVLAEAYRDRHSFRWKPLDAIDRAAEA
jgi:hypothetical protein